MRTSQNSLQVVTVRLKSHCYTSKPLHITSVLFKLHAHANDNVESKG